MRNNLSHQDERYGALTRRELFSGALAFAGASLLEGCRVSAPAHRAPAIDIGGSNSLRYHAAAQRLLFGCAVNAKALREDAAYAHVVRQQCSILVPENCMKWKAVEPEQGRFRFDDADAVVAFAEKNKIKMRGHTLVWHEALPEWVERGLTPVNARAWMTAHIQNVAGRYSGRMHSWDVVNEAIAPRDGRPDGLRDSVWLRNLGPEYIEIALRAARAADPAALLTYNDWGLDDEAAESEERRRAVLTLMRRLRQRNVPIDAVGIQAHLYVPNQRGYGVGLRRFLAALRELDLQVFITEMDVDDSRVPASEAARDAAVAQGIGAFLDTALPNSAVRAVLTWGLTTRYTWLKERYKNPSTRGLPFDDNLQPTGGFAAIRDAFDRRKILAAKTQPVAPLAPVRKWR